MVLIGIDVMDNECRLFFATFVKAFFQHYFNVILQPLSPGFSAPDNVVLELVGTVV